MKPESELDNSGRSSQLAMIALAVFGLLAPVLSFVLAVSALPDAIKIAALIALAVGYSSVCVWSYFRLRQQGRDERTGEAPTPISELEAGLSSMTEASEFFGASLKPSDMFRLVSTRISQFFPFTASALFVASEAPERLKIVQAHGANVGVFDGVEIPVDRGVAGMAWLSGEVEIDADLTLERRWLAPEAVLGLKSAFAIPLLHDNQAFGVFVLYTDRPANAEAELRTTLEAIGRRLTPLFLSSLSFERSLSNALTDTLTSLPNERAFYMVLENQLAESQRLRHERPLSVLSVDIKNFAEANQTYGFAAGDRMLAFAADLLSSQLRKMDFLSRAVNDEFLIILPTASEKTAGDIIQRIRDRFAVEPFSISEAEAIKVWLNIGWATFWQDGETAEQLLQNSRIRKQQAKAEEPTKVLWFPKEYVN